MARRLAVAAVMAVTAGTAACAPDQGTPAGSEDLLLTGTVDSLYVVGTAEGAEEEAFAGIGDVAFDAEGRLLVLDEPNHRVQLFGPSGAFVASVGRQGEGPGELQLPVSVASVSGAIALLDIQRSAIQVLELDGSLRAELAVPANVGRVELVSPGREMLMLPGDGDRREEPDSIPIYRYHLDEAVEPDVAFRVENPREVPEVGAMTRRPGGGFSMTRRGRASFLPEVRLAAADGWIAVVHGTGYAVEVRSPTGEPVTVLRRPGEAMPVTDGIRARESARVRARLTKLRNRAGGGGFGVSRMTPEQIESYADNLIFPDTVPALLGLRAAPDGTTWLLTSRGREPGLPGPIDVFGPDHRYRGRVEGIPFPDALGPDGLAAWTEEDELGVQRVRVGRVSLAGG